MNDEKLISDNAILRKALYECLCYIVLPRARNEKIEARRLETVVRQAQDALDLVNAIDPAQGVRFPRT